MAILYAVVARGTVVLAEFAAVTGNAGAVARRILEKLPPESESDSRLCFSQDRYIFHVLRSDGITYLCMANDTFGSTSLFRFCFPDFVFSLVEISIFSNEYCNSGFSESIYLKVLESKLQ
jgi:Regulated-SNARE-like domain